MVNILGDVAFTLVEYSLLIRADTIQCSHTSRHWAKPRGAHALHPGNDFPILQMEKLRSREIKLTCQGHQASKW